MNHTAIQMRKAVDSGNAVRLSALFDVLREPNRCWLFRLVAKYPGLCVSELAQVMELSVPLTSQHLKVMEQAGMVRKQREGQRTRYFEGDDPLIARIKKLYVNKGKT